MQWRQPAGPCAVPARSSLGLRLTWLTSARRGIWRSEVLSKTYVLDAFALLAYLYAEAGGARVKELLQSAADREARVLLSLINYGEATYTVERRRGPAGAQELIGNVEALPLEQVGVGRELVFAAAHAKAYCRLSHADAFAVALDMGQGAALVTGDPELKCLEGLVQIEWVGD
jgi:predicted nucleic acid-binding protein